MSYDVVSGSVNKDVAKPTVKYTSLLNVTPENLHMVGVIHYDLKGQTRQLTLRELCVPSDTQPLWQFMYDFIRASANAPLVITPHSIAAMLAALKSGTKNEDSMLAKLKYVYVATMAQDTNGNANTARYTDVSSILNLMDNATPTSETLTFNLNQ